MGVRSVSAMHRDARIIVEALGIGVVRHEVYTRVDNGHASIHIAIMSSRGLLYDYGPDFDRGKMRFRRVPNPGTCSVTTN